MNKPTLLEPSRPPFYPDRANWIDLLYGNKYETSMVVLDGLPGARLAGQSIFTTEQDPRGIQIDTAISTVLKVGGKRHES